VMAAGKKYSDSNHAVFRREYGNTSGDEYLFILDR
jgi:hypothetical protein